jgi:NADPH-dependent ferric siderophore reductase
VRVVLGGEDPRGFTPIGFDDHVQLFLLDDSGAVAMRDFTPRRFNAAVDELWIDFNLHGAGPAAIIAPQGIEVHVFLGAETALPAIGRRLDELPEDAHSMVVVEVDDFGQWCAFELSKARPIVWVTRGTLASGH